MFVYTSNKDMWKNRFTGFPRVHLTFARIKASDCICTSQSMLLETLVRVQWEIKKLIVRDRSYQVLTMLRTLLIALAAVILVCLSPEVASQQCRSGVTDEVKQSVREQLRQYQSGGNNRTFPTVAVNCGQVYMSILSPYSAKKFKTSI